MRRSRVTALATALAALALSCTERAPAYPCHPQSMEPSVGYAAEATPVVIRGTDFIVRGEQRASGGSRLVTRHRAWIEGMELGEVTYVDGATLEAVVPPGLSPGVHDLVVETPFGGRGTAASAFRVLSGTPARLTGTLAATASRVNLGEEVGVSLTLSNDGDAAALAVAPTLSFADPAALVADGQDEGPADVEGHGSHTWRWRLTAAALGDVAISVAGEGSDAGTGGAVAVPASSVAVRIAQRPAALSAALTIPATLPAGTFTATLTVTNGGEASALGVAPSTSLATASGSTAEIACVAASGGPLDLGGGTSASFTWTCDASSQGTARLHGSAGGVDASSSTAISAEATSGEGTVVTESVLLAADPFGDGTPFSSVVARGGQAWLGPSRDGAHLAHLEVDGSSLQTVALALPKDTTGSAKSGNTFGGAPPYPSLGFTGCAPDTADCGPDDEDARGVLAAASVGGTEWLVAVGAKPPGGLGYAYMTASAANPLPFRYLDLVQLLGGGARAGSAIGVVEGNVYLGFTGRGAESPKLVVLTASPSSDPGLDPPTTWAIDLQAEQMPRIGASGRASTIVGIDVIVAFAGRAYLANDGGCLRSTVASPGPYGSAPGDWADCTPSSLSRAAITPSKVADLTPADRAVPGMAAFGGRLYALRNVYVSGAAGAVAGELWACAPTASDPGGGDAQCAPGDWSLVVDAGAAAGAGRAAATLLAATPSHLYVGFDRGGGVQLFRSVSPAPTSLADFVGWGGCRADAAGCHGVGGDGFGDPANNHFLGAAVVGSDLVLTAGDGSVPVRVYRILE